MPDRRRIVGRMLLLAIGGLALLVPPVVQIFNQDRLVFGVPQIVLYLFAVWIALIVGTALLNGHLAAEQNRDYP
jgi:hypothetical protein